MIKLFVQNRNFRSLTLFATFGSIGRGTFTIFMMWAIHAMYQSTIYTGITGFMFGAPLAASFIVGPFVDRWSKVKVLRVVEAVKLCITTLMLVSHLFLYPGAWFLFISILIFSTATMFGSPAVIAFIPKIVEDDDLVKANVFMNMAGIVGGLSLGGVLIAMSEGELNFARFYSVIVATLLIAVLCSLLFHYKEPARTKVNEVKTPTKTYVSELLEGFSFVKQGAMLFFAVAIMSMSFFSDIAYVNFPMLIEVHLGDASRYILLSFLALTGGLIGSYICRATENKFKIGAIFSACFVLAGIARILFVNLLSGNFTRAIAVYMLYVGFATTVSMFFTIIIQKLSPKNLISRVTTATTSLSFTTAAIGALVGGFLGTILHVDTIFFIQGGAYIIIGILLYLSKPIRKLPKVSELKASSGDSVISEI